MVPLRNMTSEQLLLARILLGESLGVRIERELGRRALGIASRRNAGDVSRPVPMSAARRSALFAA